MLPFPLVSVVQNIMHLNLHVYILEYMMGIWNIRNTLANSFNVYFIFFYLSFTINDLRCVMLTTRYFTWLLVLQPALPFTVVLSLSDDVL